MMKCIIGYEPENLNLPPITTQQLKRFDSGIERVPLLGEWIRFGGRDHEIVRVITDLDTGMVRIGISAPIMPKVIAWCPYEHCVRYQACQSEAGMPGYPKTCAGIPE